MQSAQCAVKKGSGVRAVFTVNGEGETPLSTSRCCVSSRSKLVFWGGAIAVTLPKVTMDMEEG